MISFSTGQILLAPKPWCRSNLHATVTAKGDDVVAEDGVLVGVELSRSNLGRSSHTGGICDTLRNPTVEVGHERRDGGLGKSEIGDLKSSHGLHITP